MHITVLEEVYFRKRERQFSCHAETIFDAIWVEHGLDELKLNFQRTVDESRIAMTLIYWIPSRVLLT